MIFTMQQRDLQHAIDKMAVPVFVIDHGDDHQFRVVALNASHSRATGLELAQVIGKTPQLILPNDADAAFLTSRYEACLHLRRSISYVTRLTYKDEVKEIRTILHPISIDGGAPTRLVGSVVIAEPYAEDTVRGALGDPETETRVDIRSIEAILDAVRLTQTISSKDLMVLSGLTSKCNLTLSDVARMVAAYEHRRAALAATNPPVLLNQAQGGRTRP